MTNLPIPSQLALEHSERLALLIRNEITAAGGHISFARYMELALFAPGLGYYSAGSHKLGKNGDFITAPLISPLFAQCIAKQCQQILTAIGRGDILELGAGTGQLACDLLLELERLECLPDHYFILEISGELRGRQQELLQERCPHLLTRIEWLDSLPTQRLKGIVLANEVLDAMPIHCFRMEDNRIVERSVTFNENGFAWQLTTPASSTFIQQISAILTECPLTDGYESEINLMLSDWIKTLADTIEQGVMLLIDYGFGQREYYHPDRQQGTLMCFYQHHHHANPFVLPGLQDITAHVNFTTVAESAMDAGLRVAGYTTQAAFLLACGLTGFAAQKELSPVEQYQQNQAIKVLTLPSQMGELVKVIGLSKALAMPLLGFSLFDRRHDL
ncbi:MAG: SAM-dependent methyltransferase [Gammaproteobacteria bacterium]|nr:SAM-dependent methyltransferase [Gammaproteobacteria bacterium]